VAEATAVVRQQAKTERLLVGRLAVVDSLAKNDFALRLVTEADLREARLEATDGEREGVWNSSRRWPTRPGDAGERHSEGHSAIVREAPRWQADLRRTCTFG
jgi:hypothetical protein